jgi:NitT/TauT family transport system substrate-binding protein
MRRRTFLALAAATAALAAAPALVGRAVPPASAQEPTKLTLAISGWTGFAPLVLARETGIFKKNGLEVTIKKMKPNERHLAMAAGDVQMIATTVDTHVLYASGGVPVTQVLVLDTSAGGDGIAVRDNIKSLEDLKGKRVAYQHAAVSEFWFGYLLRKQGMSLKKDVQGADLTPQDAANAFVAGNFDAAVTYEPYLSTVRDNKGKILITSAETPGVIIDTLAFQPEFVKKSPKAVRAVVDSWFEALDYIEKDRQKAFEVMGADVKQTAEKFAASAKFVKWYDRKANQEYFARTMPTFLKEVTEVLLEIGSIKKAPADLGVLADGSFVQ